MNARPNPNDQVGWEVPMFQQIVSLDYVPSWDVEVSTRATATGNEIRRACPEESAVQPAAAVAQRWDQADRYQPTDGSKNRGGSQVPVPIDGSTRIYRIDQQHQRFQPSRLLSQSNLHLRVKAVPAAEQIEVEKLVLQEKAIRISRGSELQQIVVSAYDSIAGIEDLSELAMDLPVDLSAIGIPMDFPVLQPVTPNPPEQEITAPAPLSAIELTEKSGRISEAEPPAVVEAQPSPDPVPKSQSSTTVAPLETLKPAWEVAAFRWPRTIQKLCGDHRQAFTRLMDSIQRDQPTGVQRLGVVHAVSGQGATTLATCLAKILSDGGAKVWLADMDIERPQLEEVANIQLNRGWQEMLDAREPISEFLVRDASRRLTLMPLSPATGLISRRVELLQTIRNVTDQISSHFDYSIFDIGNVQNLMVEENCHVGFLDAVVIVSESSGEESTAVAIYEKLMAAGVPVVVIAENFRKSSRTAA